MKAKLKTRLNSLLLKIKAKNLQEWVDEASKIPELSTALEGIYCGREGSIHEKLQDSDLYLTMGWYTIDQDPKVEYCYIS